MKVEEPIDEHLAELTKVFNLQNSHGAAAIQHMLTVVGLMHASVYNSSHDTSYLISIIFDHDQLLSPIWNQY